MSNLTADAGITKNKKYPPTEQDMQTSTYKNQSTILYQILTKTHTVTHVKLVALALGTHTHIYTSISL